MSTTSYISCEHDAGTGRPVGQAISLDRVEGAVLGVQATPTADRGQLFVWLPSASMGINTPKRSGGMT